MQRESVDTTVRRRGERGVAATEYLGAVVVAVLVIGVMISVVRPDVPRTIVDGLTSAVARLAGEAPVPAAPAQPRAGDVAANGSPHTDGAGASGDPWAAPLDDTDATFAATEGPDAVERLAALGGRERRLLLEAAGERADDPDAPLAVRIGANQLLLAAVVFEATDPRVDPDRDDGGRGAGLPRHERYERWLDEDRQLVWFDPADDGRVAEIVAGDLDDAAHVAVIVPGTGNDVDTFDTSTRQYARNLADTIDDLDPEADAAVIACLCYDAPDTLLEARHTHYAEDAADGLATVTDDLRAFAVP